MTEDAKHSFRYYRKAQPQIRSDFEISQEAPHFVWQSSGAAEQPATEGREEYQRTESSPGSAAQEAKEIISEHQQFTRMANTASCQKMSSGWAAAPAPVGMDTGLGRASHCKLK